MTLAYIAIEQFSHDEWVGRVEAHDHHFMRQAKDLSAPSFEKLMILIDGAYREIVPREPPLLQSAKEQPTSEEEQMTAPTKARRKTLAREGKANKDGSYPTDTKGRAVAAKAYSTDAVRKGRMSSAQKAKIDARANRELGKGKKR